MMIVGISLFLLFFLTSAPAFGGSLTATWSDQSDNEDSFVIERRVSGGSFFEVATLRPNNERWVDVNVIIGTNYCYRIKTKNIFGESPYSNEACRTLSMYTPDAVILLNCAQE